MPNASLNPNASCYLVLGEWVVCASAEGEALGFGLLSLSAVQNLVGFGFLVALASVLS